MEVKTTPDTLLSSIAKAVKACPPPPFGQVGAALVNLMGGNPKTDVVTDIIMKAGAKAELSNSSVEGNKGLLVSSDDLQNIFLYVDTALNMPKDKTAAEEYLGYKSGDDFFKEDSHKFLDPENQVAFGTPIRAHAALWADLEQSIKNLGNELNIYAREFVSQAEEVTDVLEDLSKYLKVNGFVDKDGKDIVDCGTEMLENWKTNTEKHKQSSISLYCRLAAFKETLEKEISVSVSARVAKISDMHLTTEQAELNTKVTNLNKEISDLQDQYDQYVGLAFTGAAGMIFPPVGIISWAVTGGVFGAKAEEVRKKKNLKKDELAPLQKQLNAINRVIGGINKLESCLIDFKTAIAAAVIGVQHINTVWDSIVKDISSALQHINNISDPQYVSYVKTLLTEVKLAKDNWKECGDITRELVGLFDDARIIFNNRPKTNGAK